MTTETSYDLTDTRIGAAGVMRCCLSSVAEEYVDKPVSIGMKSTCRHCGESFTLVENTPHPTWKPDWQLEKAK